MSTYILQKDLPNAKSGAKYRKTEEGKNYVWYDVMSEKSWDVSYPAEYIENNPEWFKKEENLYHKCKYCNEMVTGDSDEGCHAKPKVFEIPEVKYKVLTVKITPLEDYLLKNPMPTGYCGTKIAWEYEMTKKWISYFQEIMNNRIDEIKIPVNKGSVLFCTVQKGMIIQHMEDGSWDKVGLTATVIDVDFEKDNVFTSDKQNYSIKGFLERIKSGRYKVLYYPNPDRMNDFIFSFNEILNLIRGINNGAKGRDTKIYLNNELHSLFKEKIEK